MQNIRAFTLRAVHGDGLFMPASMAEKAKRVGMKREGEKAGFTESLPAAIFADSEGGGAAAIMEDEGLMAIF